MQVTLERRAPTEAVAYVLAECEKRGVSNRLTMIFVLVDLMVEASKQGKMFPTVSPDTIQQAWYVAMRLEGQSHSIAEMLATQKAPQSKTDKEFLLGHANGNQFENMQGVGDYYHKIAREAGQDPKGKVYLHQLASFPGDPEAWVSGRSDVQKVCEQRGWSCQGDVNVKAQPRSSAPSGGGLATDLVDKEVAMALRDPEHSHRPVEEIREQIIEQHAPYWAKKELTGE